MLKLYDYLEAVIEEHKKREQLFESGLSYFASDIMNALDIEDTDEINSSFNRAIKALDKLNIPFDLNFKRVYRFDGEKLIADWKISALACYLIIINCNPDYENVAKAQLYFTIHH